jgi:hypothetical protein
MKLIVNQVSSYYPPSLSLRSQYTLHHILLSLNQNKQGKCSILYCQSVYTLRLRDVRLVDGAAGSVTGVWAACFSSRMLPSVLEARVTTRIRNQGSHPRM